MININDILDFSYCDFRGLTIVAFYLFLLLYLGKRYIHEKIIQLLIGSLPILVVFYFSFGH